MTALILLSEWQKSQIEFWKPIPEFPGYDVSSFGRVRSYWFKVARKGRSAGFETIMVKEPSLLRGCVDSSGYKYLNVSRYGKFPKIHRLVGQAFIPNPNNLPEINHRTGIKMDNRLGNLEWTTKKQNMNHAAQIGLRDDVLPKGESHYRAKITDSDVRVIRSRAASGDSLAAISRDYLLDASTVGDIAYRRSWKHIV